MKLARVIGKIWATQKVSSMTGIQLCVVQPLDEKRHSIGEPLIATDHTNRAGQGETVFLVDGGDAAKLEEGRNLPVDVAIVGIIDSLSTDRRGVSS